MATYLIVDDSASVRVTLAASLRKTRPSATVLESADEASALRMFSEHQPEVAFVDMMLTDEGGGLDVAQTMMDERPKTRVVLITGLPGDHPDVIKAVSLGAFAHVEKPIRESAVRAILDSIDQEEGRLDRIR